MHIGERYSGLEQQILLSVSLLSPGMQQDWQRIIDRGFRTVSIQVLHSQMP